METIIKKLAESIESNLIHDMKCEQIGDDTTILVLNAYNRYQEDERDGVDYIFNINDKEDLKCCIEGGMTAQDISCLFAECTATAKSTPFFMFGCNYPNAVVFETWEQLKSHLKNFLKGIVIRMLAYHNSDGYKQLYDHCITSYMINDNLF